MKIAWASPINIRSAIGRVSADVTRALVARGHEVRLIATETDADLSVTHQTPAPVVSWRTETAQSLRDCDVLIANIGDHYGYHGGLFHLFGHAPTLGIFHDYYLYDLFAGWLAAQGLSDAARGRLHDDTVAAVYGPEARERALAARRGEASLAEIAEGLPMTEWVARRCQGAVAHGAFYLGRLEAACPGPVRQAFMPVTGRGVPPLRARRDNTVNLLTVGVMNPNKCVDRVISAICSRESLKARIAYRLVGPIDPSEAARLQGLADAGGYDRLTIIGAVDEDELARRLAEADVISCLRRPVLEGASGSAIEALMAGRPTIVADAGFYQELPDELVFKVGPEVEPEQIARQLERLCQDEALRGRAGEAARAWAERRFDLDDYAAQVEAMAAETIEAAPVLAVGARLGHELAALGLGAEDSAVERIADVLAGVLPTR